MEFLTTGDHWILDRDNGDLSIPTSYFDDSQYVRPLLQDDDDRLFSSENPCIEIDFGAARNGSCSTDEMYVVAQNKVAF